MIFNKSSLTLMDDLEPDVVHAVVTDPPYGMHLLGEDWDKVLPDVLIWEACFRVLRPGGFCLAFGHTRLYHRLACQLESVGFVIKDCLCWGYASGFPRSVDISKGFDDDTWDGYGTTLKTAWEPIIMAQKPFEGSYIDNVAKYHVGALNIDACRIPYSSDADKKSLESFLNFAGNDHGDARYFSANEGNKKQVNVHPDGRWPANLLWLDPLHAEYDKFFMVPKPHTGEKRDYNSHSTVKPVRLMDRLISLVTPKPSKVKTKVFVLDPFMGSGSTGVACRKLKRTFIGYEIDESSFEIAQRRLMEQVGHFDMFDT